MLLAAVAPSGKTNPATTTGLTPHNRAILPATVVAPALIPALTTVLALSINAVSS